MSTQQQGSSINFSGPVAKSIDPETTGVVYHDAVMELLKPEQRCELAELDARWLDLDIASKSLALGYMLLARLRPNSRSTRGIA